MPVPTLRAVTAAALPLIFASLAIAQSPSGPPAARVALDAARLERVDARREVRGELRATRRSLVASEEPGRVVELLVREGDAVEEGQVLAKLDSTIRALEVDRAASAVKSAEAQLEERRAFLEKAQRDAQRAASLLERASASQNEVDDKNSIERQAAARVAQSEADLKSATIDESRLRERLSKMIIHAPFAGAVVSLGVEVGEWVTDGDPVVEVVETSEIEAWLSVSQQFIGAIRLAERRPVQVRIEATGEVVEAPIAAVVPSADEGSRMFPVRVRLPNPEGRLRPGMSVVGFAPTGHQEETLTLSKDAVLRDDAGQYVYFSAGGVAAVARIETLFAVGDRVAVRAPALKDGSLIVVEGNERLFPGQPLVAPQPAAESDPPAQSSTPGRAG